MRVLHTADWHLGQKFTSFDRFDEHQCFLDWLLQAIDREQIDALVVAGDIFDTANPGPTAQRQYYNFLARLSKSSTCKDVVIVGGNHDSPNLLNAPSSILKALNIHIVGTVPEVFDEQCIALPTGGDPQLVVAAVPYLRDKDIRISTIGESALELEGRIRQGIAAHYRQVADCICHYREQNIPVMATGHLFAQGGVASEDSERTIHVGSLGQITADAFTDAFDYVALGHLHRHQMVGGHEHIRYSGSPIPLSFSEVHNRHQVLILNFDGAQRPIVTSLEVPCSRKLVRIKGELDDVLMELEQFSNDGFDLPAWADVEITSNESSVRVVDRIDSIKEQLAEKIIIVKYRHYKVGNATDAGASNDANSDIIDDLSSPLSVFKRLLEEKGYVKEAEEHENLMTTFSELLSLDDLIENV